MYEIDKKSEIEAMCQRLIEHLRQTGKSSDSLIISAINVATIQVDFANYRVGVIDKQRRQLRVMDAEHELMRELIERKRYAKRLNMGLDRLVEMYQNGEIH